MAPPSKSIHHIETNPEYEMINNLPKTTLDHKKYPTRWKGWILRFSKFSWLSSLRRWIDTFNPGIQSSDRSNPVHIPACKKQGSVDSGGVSKSTRYAIWLAKTSFFENGKVMVTRKFVLAFIEMANVTIMTSFPMIHTLNLKCFYWLMQKDVLLLREVSLEMVDPQNNWCRFLYLNNAFLPSKIKLF